MEKQHVVELRRAINIVGGQTALARFIAKFLKRPTFSQQTVSHWVRNEVLIGAEYWPAIEAATADDERPVTRNGLRPDVFETTASAPTLMNEPRSVRHG